MNNEAVPEKLIVLKAGGSLLERGLSQELASDIQKVSVLNKIVLVHGGGIEVTEMAKKLGKEQRFIISPDGFRSRYTDQETVEIYTMVMAGKLSKQLVRMLASKGVRAVGLSGLDGSLLRAERKKRLVIINERGRKMAIDGGYTGRIVGVNTELLRLLIDSKYVPVISPVAIGDEYESLNVDGDRTAANVAAALRADLLVLLTDVEGLLIDGKRIPKITVGQAKEMIPRIGPGMITKLQAAIDAIEQGVGEVVITSGGVQNAVSSALAHQNGTVISHE